MTDNTRELNEVEELAYQLCKMLADDFHSETPEYFKTIAKNLIEQGYSKRSTPDPIQKQECQHEYELNKNGLNACIKCNYCPAIQKQEPPKQELYKNRIEHTCKICKTEELKQKQEFYLYVKGHNTPTHKTCKVRELRILKNEQLISDPVKGDCFRACITSLLGIPNTDELPDGDKDWFVGWGNYLRKMGLNIRYEEEAFWREGYWIASVKSLNFPDVTHAIIMNGQEIYFDPSPNKKYQEGENLLSKDIVLGGWYFEVEDFSKLCSNLSINASVGTTVEEIQGLIKQYLQDNVSGRCCTGDYDTECSMQDKNKSWFWDEDSKSLAQSVHELLRKERV
jgi:hypothetical protein